MDVCLHFSVLCCPGLASGQSLLQGVLPIF
jgi:hypothetical protein